MPIKIVSKSEPAMGKAKVTRTLYKGDTRTTAIKNNPNRNVTTTAVKAKNGSSEFVKTKNGKTTKRLSIAEDVNGKKIGVLTKNVSSGGNAKVMKQVSPKRVERKVNRMIRKTM
jgi:hypothetical protein